MKHVPLKPAGPLYSVPFYERTRWENDHKSMYDRIKNMKGVLDHTPPWRDDRLMDNLRKARKWYEAANGAEIARENKLLVDKLYSISKNSYKNQSKLRRGEPVAAPGMNPMAQSSPDLRTGGKVHDALRRRNKGTIEADNEALVGRILSVKKTIDLGAFRKDFREHVEFSKLRSRLPKEMLAASRDTPAPKKRAMVRSSSTPAEGTRGFLLAPGDLAPPIPAHTPPRPVADRAPDKERQEHPSSAGGGSSGGGPVAPAPMMFVGSFIGGGGIEFPASP